MGDVENRRKFLRQLLASGSVAWVAGKSAVGKTWSDGFANPVPFVQDPSEPSAAYVIDRGFFAIDLTRDPYTVFSLSVASGDPRSNGIVLWTRIDPQVIPNISAPGLVAYQIATQDTFAPESIIVEGLAEVMTARDYAVKLPLQHSALRPFKTYYYRFIYDGCASRTGRFKTLPSEQANIDRVRFGFISCQDYSNGYYTALFYLAQENLDFVVHLGDYIYETIDDPDFQGGQVRPVPPLPSGGNVAANLEDYRHLYRVYRSDRNLQAVHEKFAFIQIWDDHEFQNDSYREFHPDNDPAPPPPAFRPQLRQAANQAWAEYGAADVPFDPSKGPLESIRIYRSFRFGKLLELIATDERLYRDGPPCGFGQLDRYLATRCPAAEATSRTMLGTTQREWFINKVTTTPATWKIWANEVTLMQFKVINTLFINNPAFIARLPPWLRELLESLPPQLRVDRFANLDQWDGYPTERARLLNLLRERNVKNLIAITGDIHTFIAGYLKTNFDNLAERPVGVELVVASVTSGNLSELIASQTSAQRTPVSGAPMPAVALSEFPIGLLIAPVIQLNNPHMAFFDSSTHGYCVMEVTPFLTRCTMKAVSTIRQPEATLRNVITFIVPRDQALLIPTISLG